MEKEASLSLDPNRGTPGLNSGVHGLNTEPSDPEPQSTLTRLTEAGLLTLTKAMPRSSLKNSMTPMDEA